MGESFFIGELSQQSGITAQTIRYYEQMGLLEPPDRTEAKYRLYSQAHLERLRFIVQAKLFGLSLEEIKQLIDLGTGGIAPCDHLKNMVEHHLRELDTRIQELAAFRKELAGRYDKIEGQKCDGKICGIIEDPKLMSSDERTFPGHVQVGKYTSKEKKDQSDSHDYFP